MVAPGGTLAELLKYLETQVQADARVQLNRSKTLVVVWSFNDLFAEKSPGNRYCVIDPIPDTFFRYQIGRAHV